MYISLKILQYFFKRKNIVPIFCKEGKCDKNFLKPYTHELRLSAVTYQKLSHFIYFLI